jgi:transposase-like protein
MRFSQTEKKEIVEAIQSRKTTMTELAKRYNVSIAAIGYVFKTMTGNGLRPQLSQSLRQAIVTELQSGKTTQKELAATYDVDDRTIGRVYRKETGEPWLARLSQTAKKEIVTKLQSGEATIRELAARYKVHPETVSRNFKHITGKSLYPAARHLSQKDSETIVRELKAGKKVAELAREYGVHPGRIRKIYKTIVGEGLSHKLSQADIEAIITALQTKKATMTELAGKYDIDQSTISHLFRRITGHSLKPQLSQSDRKEIVAALLAGKATIQELAAKYKVGKTTICSIFKHQVGKPLTVYQKVLKTAIKNSRYRAWQISEKRMYAVLGLDWFNQKVLIATGGVAIWHDMALFTIMEYTGLRDRKRTPEYPKGQRIYLGDIFQFPIQLQGNDGAVSKTIVKDVVTFDRESGWFILPRLDGDPLCLHHDEGEVIGNIYEHPERMPEAA